MASKFEAPEYTAQVHLTKSISLPTSMSSNKLLFHATKIWSLLLMGTILMEFHPHQLRADQIQYSFSFSSILGDEPFQAYFLRSCSAVEKSNKSSPKDSSSSGCEWMGWIGSRCRSRDGTMKVLEWGCRRAGARMGIEWAGTD